MRKNWWFGFIWATLGVLMVVSGFFSQNVVTVIVGLSLALGNASLYLTSYVKSDSVVKRGLEVVFAVVAVGIIGYGYIVTRSLILGLMIIFITAMVLVAFTIGYLLHRSRDKPENMN
jgi:hypothetical protein